MLPAIASTVAATATLVSTLAFAPIAQAATLRITLDSLSPTNGTALTPTWFGFHDGSFDLYNRGEAATLGLERLAEDGTIDDINAEFLANGGGTVQGALFGPTAPPILPGESTSILIDVDASAVSSRYFSYAAMLLPSNDFFIANGNPLAFRIFDDAGRFLGADFTVTGQQVLDSGTEVNDELFETTAFLGQSVPNTGTTEGGTVQLAGGFIPGGRILSEPRFANADFTAPGYQVARFRVELVNDPAASVPEPGVVVALLAVGGLMLGYRQQQQA
ncbi:MAG: PEP-CTERM sorting domain-containing protein [Phormidesmis priestleyi]|uniref:PEP-CTERM sorting domain-containing protein n=1 Tax=Phormidesmis priestleyi TaxID=268141 RepID=A0A2W4XDT0_9CYAN|nr:MAG: PEP-CTERM sorting domain-containing protein [Phormidesmis priestleyi]